MEVDELLLVDPAALDKHVRKAAGRSDDDPSRPGDAQPDASTSATSSEEPASSAGTTEPAAPAAAMRVTPALLSALAEQRAPAALPPQRLVTSTGPTATPVYTSDGAGGATWDVRFDAEEPIQRVVESLNASWWLSAAPADKRALAAGRPLIPQDLDRTLLIDLCSTLGIDQLDTAMDSGQPP
jgi:hypothetical protein